MSSEPQGPWVDAMVRVGATDPRNGRPSWNRLAEMAGISTTTLTMMVEGKRKTSVPTIEKIAKALRVKPDRVHELLGSNQRVQLYQVPDEVHLLTPRQQKALTEMIRAIAADTAGGEDGGDTAATSEEPVALPPVLSEPTDLAGTSFIVMTKGSGKTEAMARLMRHAREVEGMKDFVFVTAAQLQEEDPDLYEDLAARVTTH